MVHAPVQDEVTQAEMAAYITQATCDVFSTMLGQDVRAGEPFTERTAASPSSGMVSLVGLAGDWVGTGGICCSSSSACRLSSRLLMAEYQSVDEDVLDAIAELTNMIIGNVKTALEDRLGFLGLSVPTVIFGRHFQTRNAGQHSWVVVPFHCDGDRIHVQLCLTRNRMAGKSVVRPAFPVPHLLNF